MKSEIYTMIDLDRRLFNESMSHFYSSDLRFHCENGVGIDKNIFRPGSKKFFDLFKEVRKLHSEGKYELSESEVFYILETSIGEFDLYRRKT